MVGWSCALQFEARRADGRDMSPGISTRLLATQSDERLLRLVREGHERAFEALVNRYRKPLSSYCRRLSLPEARTEDVLQQALLKTWIALRDGAEVRDIKAWLYRVVHNAAVNAVRDAAYDRERVADPTLRVEGGQGDIERGLVVREALAEVAALPPLQREVIVRTAVGGHSHEQVASDLGLSDGAVRGLLYRARTTLRTATTALTPPQLLLWLAGRADQGSGAPERLSEFAAGGGTLGMGGLLLKGGVAAITAGTLITGAAVVQLQGGGHRHHGHPGALAVPRSDASTTAGGAAVAAVPSASPGSGGVRHSASPGAARAHGAGLGSRETIVRLQTGGAGEPAHHTSGAVLRHRSTTAPGSAPGQATPSAPTTPAGSVPYSAGSDQGTSKTGSGGATAGGPVGSAAGTGSSAESGSEAPAGGGSGGGQQAPSGSESGGSTPSGGGEESSGAQSGSGGSGASGSEQSGGLVKTVVHEVGGVVEHLLH